MPSQMRGEKLHSAPILNYVTIVLSPTRICISVWCCEVLAIVEILSAEIIFVDTIIHLPATATARTLSAGRCLNLRRVEVAGRRHSVALSLSTVSLFLFSVLEKVRVSVIRAVYYNALWTILDCSLSWPRGVRTDVGGSGRTDVTGIVLILLP